MSRVTAPEVLLKQPSEKIRYSMKFGNVLSSGETISSPSVSSAKRDGGTSDLTISGVTVSSGDVLFWIEGGTTGVSYHVEVTVNGSSGAIYEGDGILRVVDK